MALVISFQLNRIEQGVLIVRLGFDAIKVYTNTLVGVADGHIDGKVILKDVVAGKVELGEGGINHMELNLVGTDYEPEEEDCNPYDDNDGDNEFEQKA